MPEIKACIFDLDGVLVDTARYHFEAWKATANQLGIDFTQDHNEQLKGVSRRESLEYILHVGNMRLSEEELQAKLTEKNTHYLELIRHMDPSEVLPGVLNFLEEIKAAGMRTALGSASKNAPIILERCGLKKYLDKVIDGTSFTHSKPHPEVFQKGIQALHVFPEMAVVFEDAVNGVKAGKSAGARVVGVGDPETLYEADLVIPGFKNFDLNALITVFAKQDSVNNSPFKS